MFWLLTILACGFEATDLDTGSAPESAERGAAVDYVVYPTAEMNQVLLYHGHGGLELRPSAQVQATWEADGWDPRVSDQLPPNLKPFRLIVFTATGTTSTDSAPDVFTDEEVGALKRALDRGTRLAFLQESEQCVTGNMSALLNDLGMPMRFDQALVTTGERIQTFSAVATGTQLMADVTAIGLVEPCTVTSGGSWLLRTEEQSVPLIVSQQYGNAGDVVLVGDTDFLKDETLQQSHNLIFAQNLAQVLP